MSEAKGWHGLTFIIGNNHGIQYLVVEDEEMIGRCFLKTYSIQKSSRDTLIRSMSGKDVGSAHIGSVLLFY